MATLKGIVISDIQKKQIFGRQKTTFVLDLKEIKTKWGWKQVKGKTLVNIYRDIDVAYGDQLILNGKLHQPYNFSNDKNFFLSRIPKPQRH